MNRKFLIKLFTFVGGIYFFLEFFLPKEINGYEFGAYNDEISRGLIVIGSMAAGLGIINILFIHGGKILFKKSGWSNSLALIIGLFFMFGVTIADWVQSEKITSSVKQYYVLSDFSKKISSDQKSKDLLLAETKKLINKSRLDTSKYKEQQAKVVGSVSTKKYSQEIEALATIHRDFLTEKSKKSLTTNLYNFLYDGLFVALGSAMFALLAFYVASAAYRAFRIKTLESGLMMTAALLVMLGQIPFGIWVWEGFPDVRLWLLEVPNSAAFRAITIGSGVAGLIMAFRMWLSIESETFNEDE